MANSNERPNGYKGNIKIGDLLVEKGIIDRKTLIKALKIQKGQKKRLGQVLIDMGVADETQIAKGLASKFKIDYVTLEDREIPRETISLIPQDMAESHLVIPIEEKHKKLVVAMADPLDHNTLKDLQFLTGMPTDFVVATGSDIQAAIEKYYPKGGLERKLGATPNIHEKIEITKPKDVKEGYEDIEKLLKYSERPPVVRFLNAVLADAITLMASDIHIEPQETNMIIRYRIDGILREIVRTDKTLFASLVNRIKVISDIDISIKRKPQDGRAHAKYGDKTYDLRVSSLPTAYGEHVSIRILDPTLGKQKIENLGFDAKAIENLKNALNRSHGITLITGPTGSGKSTSLYACLNRLNSQTVNIMTVEDPIEYDIKGINQVQINPLAGITFASGFRSILRQDPDIVMIGEIRDSETALIAVQAAQTGHLVLSTLHTNDASSAVTRLLNMGVDVFAISDTLNAVIGQRLVRKICDNCKAPNPKSQEILRQLPSQKIKNRKIVFWKGTGCKTCNYTGYLGRVGVFEILIISPAIQKLISPDITSFAIREKAEKEGFQSMSMDGLSKAVQGVTTIEEVLRVVPFKEEEPSRVPKADVSWQKESKMTEVSSDEKAAPGIRRKKEKILVVDDSKDILKMLRYILESENYSVITAQNGIEGLKTAIQEKPNLIVTDLMMPEMDGVELIKELKASVETRFIPIIMLTVKDEVDSEVEVLNAGADDYLIKPVNAKRFLARIKRLLSKPIGGEICLDDEATCAIVEME